MTIHKSQNLNISRSDVEIVLNLWQPLKRVSSRCRLMAAWDCGRGLQSGPQTLYTLCLVLATSQGSSCVTEPVLTYRVSQKKRPQKLTSNMVLCSKAFYTKFCHLCMQLPHLLPVISKTQMIFIKHFSRYEFKHKVTLRTIFVIFSIVQWFPDHTQSNFIMRWSLYLKIIKRTHVMAGGS